MTDDFDTQEWRQAARLLGFEARERTTTESRAEWAMVELSLGAAVPLERVTCEHALVGTHDGTRVIVRMSPGSFLGWVTASASFRRSLGVGLEFSWWWRGDVPVLRARDTEHWNELSRFEREGATLTNRLETRPVEALGDDFVSLRNGGGGAAEHVALVTNAVSLAKHFDAALRAVPRGPREQIFYLGLQAFAARHPDVRVSKRHLSLRGVVDGFSVSIERKSTTEGVITDARIELGGHIELRLDPEQLGDRLGKLFGVQRDVATGDRAFDRAFLVDGPPSDRARAQLSDEARAALLHLVGLGAKVQLRQGILRASMEGLGGASADLLEGLVAAAKALAPPTVGSPYRS
jgi:hypothetical protein